jgi:hypothetical protein
MNKKYYRPVFISLLLIFAAAMGSAQKGEDFSARLREARDEAKQAKKESANALRVASPADFNDTASFGKTTKFLGSLYAGTVFVYRSCDPQILLDELQTTLAPDDHCIVHNSTTPMTTTTVFDPVWQTTIPGTAVNNVIYPMLNNHVGYDAFPSSLGQPFGNNGYGTGMAFIRFTPVVTIESDALNDPAAIDPNTGLPMNGSFTANLPGTRVKTFMVGADDYIAENDNYASVGGRGFSRTYFEALGLPQTVINQLFRKPVTLKFGIRADVNGPVQQAFFSYTFRLLGN